MMDQPKFIRTDADGFPHISGPAILVLEVSRREIESCNYTSSLERLMLIADTRESTLHYRESLILQITGYDADTRELAEIPEVRKFFSCLVDAWPHWMWYLSREMGTLSLFMSLICQVKVHRRNGSFGLEFSEPGEMPRKLAELLDRGIALFAAFDIPDADAEASAMSAIASLGLDPATPHD